jgi:membrane-bound ClpP family serine protease
MNNLLIQLIALFTLAAFAGSFQSKARKEILLWQMLSMAFWIIHYSLLGAWTGTFLVFTNGMITLLFLYKNKNQWASRPWVLYLALGVSILVTIFTWNNFYSIFALAGIMSMVLGKWQDDTKKIKLIGILACLFWILYDIFVGSWGGIIAEIVIMLSATIGLIRSKESKTEILK